MSYQTIEEYFNQFPDDVEEIDVEFISDHLPDLSRFYKLKRFFILIPKYTLPALLHGLELLVMSPTINRERLLVDPLNRVQK